MSELTPEQNTFAIARLAGCLNARQWDQTDLANNSGIGQPTISKVLQHKTKPSEELLSKLFNALGLKLDSVLSDYDSVSSEIQGYLATPLTGLSDNADKEVRRIVEQIRLVAAASQADHVPFQLYWPGERTHPKAHAVVSAENVYVFDRSRASTYDFILLLCAAPSFGVGQENEIATQAGLPAIRLVPKAGLSRMMLGSFLNAINVSYEGSLETGVSVDVGALEAAFKEVRNAHFHLKAQARGVNTSAFGARLSNLITGRCSNKLNFARDVGITQNHLSALIDEPFAVSNPSSNLLIRMAVRLDVSIAYLLGESDDSDPVWVQSKATWRQWIDDTPGIDAKIALEMRDDWCRTHREAARHDTRSTNSYRASTLKVMSTIDWDKTYKQMIKAKSSNESQPSLL